MKTTIVIDEAKLKRVMSMTGIKTRREAIDYALDQAERAAKILSLFEGDFFINSSKLIVDPSYDLSKIRSMDRPRRRRVGSH